MEIPNLNTSHPSATVLNRSTCLRQLKLVEDGEMKALRWDALRIEIRTSKIPKTRLKRNLTFRKV